MIVAYLDPGSGSLLLQAILGGVAGIGVAARAMRNRWRGKASEEREETSEEVSAETQEG